MTLKCRFYENELPEIGDVVVVDVKSIQTMGAYVSLMEYEGIEGMILLSELSRRRIRSVNKLLRVGRKEVVSVIRVDKEKKYIDLSKRQVSREETEVCEKRYANAKTVNQILVRLSQELNYETEEQLENVFKQTAWYFDKKKGQKAASYDIFKQAVTNPEVLDECDIEPAVKEKLLSDIKRKLMPQAVKIRSEFDLSCFAYEGIRAVKHALTKGLEHSCLDLEIKINLIASPSYAMTCQTLERERGLDSMNKALDSIKSAIEENGGIFKVVEATKIVVDHEERDFQKRMAELEEMNVEVSGDDETDSECEDSDEENLEENGVAH